MLQINTNVGFNAPGRIADALGDLALDAGWNSYMAYGRNVDGEPRSRSTLIRIGKDRDVFLHGLGTRIFDRHGLYSAAATRKFLEEVDGIKPDVIHIHNLHGYYLNYPMLFRYIAEKDIPVVWTLHDCWPLTGHCAFFGQARCYKWQNACHHCPLRKDYPASAVLDNSRNNLELKHKWFTLPRHMHIVTVSKWLQGVVEASFLGQYPVHTIYNGIDLPEQATKTHGGTPIVLAAANKWEPRKGLQHIYELRKRLPSYIQMRVIGLTPRQIRSLPDGITGVPRINGQQELFDQYRRAWVFVNPSQGDSLSIVNIEAQACGTPVAAFAIEGITESLAPGISVAVEDGNVGALAENILAMIDNRRNGSDQAQDLRAFVTAKFNPRTNYSAYLDLYDSL